MQQNLPFTFRETTFVLQTRSRKEFRQRPTSLDINLKFSTRIVSLYKLFEPTKLIFYGLAGTYDLSKRTPVDSSI